MSPANKVTYNCTTRWDVLGTHDLEVGRRLHYHCITSLVLLEVWLRYLKNMVG